MWSNPDFARAPLGDKQIPERGKELSNSEREIVEDVMLKKIVEGEFTTADEVAQPEALAASFGPKIRKSTTDRTRRKLNRWIRACRSIGSAALVVGYVSACTVTPVDRSFYIPPWCEPHGCPKGGDGV